MSNSPIKWSPDRPPPSELGFLDDQPAKPTLAPQHDSTPIRLSALLGELIKFGQAHRAAVLRLALIGAALVGALHFGLAMLTTYLLPDATTHLTALPTMTAQSGEQLRWLMLNLALSTLPSALVAFAIAPWFGRLVGFRTVALSQWLRIVLLWVILFGLPWAIVIVRLPQLNDLTAAMACAFVSGWSLALTIGTAYVPYAGKWFFLSRGWSRTLLVYLVLSLVAAIPGSMLGVIVGAATTNLTGNLGFAISGSLISIVGALFSIPMIAIGLALRFRGMSR